MDDKRSHKWKHGWINRDTGAFVIRVRHGGARYEVTTEATNEVGAEVEWLRFIESPSSYKPPSLRQKSVPKVKGLFLDDLLIAEYLTYSKNVKENSDDWRRQQRRHMFWWLEKLDGVNLREFDLRQHVYKNLHNQTEQSGRIKVIKHFFTWLHDPKNGPKDDARLLAPGEARCVELDLHAPQHHQRNRIVRRKWFPKESHQQMLDAMAELINRKHRPEEPICPYWMQDGCVVLAATGWHVTELERFVFKVREAGAIEEHPVVKRGLVLITEHKGKKIHKTHVSEEVAVAAQRLQSVGTFDISRLTNKMAEISGALGLKPSVSPGRYRHSVAVWMLNDGVPLDTISTFLGHTSRATTIRFYAELGIPLNPTMHPAVVAA